MSETEVKNELDEVVNAANKDAAPAEPTHLKNDGEDLGKAVVKPTDPDGQTAVDKVKKVSDQVNKDAKDGSLPKDQKPAGMKEEETEVEGNLQANKWGTYVSIIIVSGFFIWLLITNGNLN